MLIIAASPGAWNSPIVNGVLTRKVDHLVSELWIRMSKDQVSRICRELEGRWPRTFQGADGRLCGLRARGLEGVRLCVSDNHLGLKAAVANGARLPLQRCTVHSIRSMRCEAVQRNMVSAALREVFAAEDFEDARERCHQ